MEKLIEYFKHKQVDRVLDVGTGPGNFIKVLQDVFPQAEFTGVDPDSNSLKEARDELPDVEFNLMTGEQLSFEDDSFDVAAISMALHHLNDVQLTLSEMKRVVRPGGWIIVNELFSDGLNPAQQVHKRMHHFRSKIDRINGVVHNESFTRRQILDQLKESGLTIELRFDHKKATNPSTSEEIAERKLKLWTALETINGRPEYSEMAKEIPSIEADLERHGYEMATRIVVVARVQKQ